MPPATRSPPDPGHRLPRHSALTFTKLIKLRRAREGVRQKTYDLGPLMGAILRRRGAAAACFNEVLAAQAGPASVTLAATRAWARGMSAGR
jgi:hypothetical protein